MSKGLAIRAMGLTRVYNYYTKEPGLRGTWRSLFKRESGANIAVKELDLTVYRGEVVGLIGPNGAGKTTTLKMFSGLLLPTSGSLEVLGYQPWRKEYRFLKSIGYVMGNRTQLNWDLTSLDSFSLNQVLYDVEPGRFCNNVNELARLLGVDRLLNVQVRRLSLGERMKLELISGVAHEPKLLFLDEPTLGLDFESQRALRYAIRQVNERFGTTVIITSHNIEDIRNVCQRLVLINHGQLVYDGPTARLVMECDESRRINVAADDLGSSVGEDLGPRFAQGNMVSFLVRTSELQSWMGQFLRRYPNTKLQVEDPSLEDIIISHLGSEEMREGIHGQV